MTGRNPFCMMGKRCFFSKEEMNVAQSVNLQAKLAPYRTAFDGTEIPSVYLHIKEGKTGPYDSKIAGDPYFPKADEYPLDGEGQGDHHKRAARSVPSSVPRMKPITVSPKVTDRLVRRLPSESFSRNRCHIFVGELKMRGSIQDCRLAASHAPKNTMKIKPW